MLCLRKSKFEKKNLKKKLELFNEQPIIETVAPLFTIKLMTSLLEIRNERFILFY